MSDAAADDKVWLFEDFEEGAAVGSVEVTVSQDNLNLWRSIYGMPGEDSAPEHLPQSLLTAAMMEAYLRVIPRRPPGNVHAAQKLVFSGTRVPPGAHLVFDFSCISKELKRERRWVTLAMRCSDGRQPVMEGEISTVWAK